MSSRILFLLAALMLVASGCSKEKQFEVAESEIMLVDQLPEDFVVPEVVWESMKSEAGPEGGGGEEKEGEKGGGGHAKEKPIIYTSVKVFMKEKNKGVLKKPLLAYEFARGGGEIDLASVVGAQNGTFFLGFEFPEFETVTQKKAFFISENRQRKVEGEILGSGCRKLLDISNEFFKQIAEEGIKINTTRNRHDSIMGGHMIFIGETEKSWLLTQVTFFDSSRTDLFCKGFRTAPEKVGAEVH